MFFNINEEAMSRIQTHSCNTASAILEFKTINEVDGVSTGSENDHFNPFEQTIHVLVKSGTCHITEILLAMDT